MASSSLKMLSGTQNSLSRLFMEFLEQNCTKTLREGLEELYINNPEVAASSKSKGKSFQDHDLTHVIFGCDTSIRGEIILKPWILFGTNISKQELMDYSKDEEVKRLRKEGIALMGGLFITTFKLVFILLPQFFHTWFLRVRKMKDQWPHSSITDDMLQKRIVDLRNEYGIQVVPPETKVSMG